MNEGSAVPLVIDSLEVNYKFAGVLFGISDDFCTEQGDDMVRDNFPRFILKVSVVDAEVGIEPVDFIRDEIAWNKPLSGCQCCHHKYLRRY